MKVPASAPSRVAFFVKGIQDYIARLKAAPVRNAPQRKEALARIGMAVRNQARLNVTRQRLIDKGALRASLSYVADQDSVTVGSFGIPYAAVHEFGFKGLVNVKTHDRLIKQAFGRPLAQDKRILVRQHRRKMTVPERAYLRPAFEMRQGKIAEILKVLLVSAFEGKK